MKNKLLIAISFICMVANAQRFPLKNEDIFLEAKYFESHIWNDLTKEYDMDARNWVDADFVLHREYIVFGERDGEYHRLWWVFYEENKSLGDCYITEGDAVKVCIDYDDNKIFFLTDYDESKERWTDIGLFARIETVRPFDYTR
jgi:hypothetical protein